MARLERDWTVGTTFVPEPEALLRPARRRQWVRRLGILVRPLARLRWRHRIALAIALTMTITSAWVYFGPASLNAARPLQNAFLYDRSGTLLAELSPEENRVVIPIAEIPKAVQDAFVAAEDERFWSHPGVDPLAIARAAWNDLHGGREGASTITQQYVKNVFVGNRRTIGRKVREAIIALRIDRRYPKSKILEAYLNTIYLGQGAYGVEAAARLYFGKPAAQLTLGEGALLAGLAIAPSKYSPRVNRAGATKRRDYVLAQMSALGMITSLEAGAARDEPIKLVKPKARPVVAPMFVDFVRREIQRDIGEDVLYRGGLRVTTTLDLDAQRAAEDAIEDVLGDPGDPEVAVVSIDALTGEVRVMVGGRNKRLGDFNLATQARRPAGSAFKPFVLAAALMEGKKLTTVYPAPGTTRLKIPGGVWKVSNYDYRGYGSLTLRSALAYSVNTVYARLARDIGAAKIIEVARRVGVRSPLQEVPALALGISGVSPLEMASAYTAFTDAGLWAPPSGMRKVVTMDRQVLFDGEREPRPVIPADVANDVQDALGAVTKFGTGSRVRIDGFTTYGKTGTTENRRDAWFVGAAGGYVTAVWMGHPSNKPMTRVNGIRVTGGSFPATIWMRTMERLLADSIDRDVKRPKPRTGPTGPTRPAESVEPLPSAEPSPTPTRRGFPIPLPSLP